MYNTLPDEFASDIAKAADMGVRIVGGCCGTDPSYIDAIVRAVSGMNPKPVTEKNISVVSSYTRAVTFGRGPVLIGERINPTGKKRFKQALRDNDMDYILQEGVNQQEKGVHILDVNVGLPEIDEAAMIKNVVCELQAVTDLLCR